MDERKEKHINTAARSVPSSSAAVSAGLNGVAVANVNQSGMAGTSGQVPELAFGANNATTGPTAANREPPAAIAEKFKAMTERFKEKPIVGLGKIANLIANGDGTQFKPVYPVYIRSGAAAAALSPSEEKD